MSGRYIGGLLVFLSVLEVRDEESAGPQSDLVLELLQDFFGSFDLRHHVVGAAGDEGVVARGVQRLFAGLRVVEEALASAGDCDLRHVF